MKKFLKFLLIIALIAGVAFVGYKVYERFWLNQVEDMDAENGWEKYKIAANKSLSKDFYNIAYSKKVNDSEKKFDREGYITIDEFGHYHEWNEEEVAGSEYVVKMNGTNYGVFSETAGEKTSSKISISNYIVEYREIQNEQYLKFFNNSLISDGDEQLKKDFYLSSWNVDNEEIKHTFGETRDGYVWETKYTCTYTEGEKRFSSELTRKIYFDSMGINKVTIEKTDREIDEEGKKVSKGTKKTFELNYEIRYDTNQAIVKTDFSEYPDIA